MLNNKIKEKGIKKTWLADKLGVSKQLLNHYLKNSMPIDIENKLREILK